MDSGMASIREQILEAAVAALNANRPSGIPAATRLRGAYAAAQLPVITVFYQDDTPRKPGGSRSPVVQRTMTLVVECRHKADQADTAIETALDPMICWVVKTLSGSTFGGLAMEVVERTTKPEVSMKEALHGRTEVPFDVLYQTKTNDMEFKS